MKLTFRQKLFLPLFLSWVCLLAVFTVNAMQSRALRLEERKNQLSDAGQMAVSIVKDYAALAAAGTLPLDEAKKQALDRVRALRYGASGYLSIHNDKALLMHPTKPENVGKSIDAVTDAEGRKIYVDAIAATRAAVTGSPNTCGPSRVHSNPSPS